MFLRDGSRHLPRLSESPLGGSGCLPVCWFVLDATYLAGPLGLVCLIEVWEVSHACTSHMRVVHQWHSPFYDESQSTKLVFGLALSVNSFSGFPECV